MVVVVVLGRTCVVGHRNLPYKANLKSTFYVIATSLLEKYLQIYFSNLLFNLKQHVGTTFYFSNFSTIVVTTECYWQLQSRERSLLANFLDGFLSILTLIELRDWTGRFRRVPGNSWSSTRAASDFAIKRSLYDVVLALWFVFLGSWLCKSIFTYIIH